MCTLRPDGSPHVTPVWFNYQQEAWWIGSDKRTVKVRNVKRDPASRSPWKAALGRATHVRLVTCPDLTGK
jgi:hypothetical protein